MIIPIRCMTCGKVLADKWNKYLDLVKELETKDESKLLDVNAKNIEKHYRESCSSRNCY